MSCILKFFELNFKCCFRKEVELINGTKEICLSVSAEFISASFSKLRWDAERMRRGVDLCGWMHHNQPTILMWHARMQLCWELWLVLRRLPTAINGASRKV